MTGPSATAPTALSRVAVVNRGEPAVRFMRALADYNRERATAITAVALYTEADRGAPFLRLADEVVPLGPALRKSASGALVSAYTDHAHVLAALADAGCDAVWPGWGFIAEDAAFVAALEARGITFIGPSSHAMQRLGDKIAAKRLAAEAGVPMAPWHTVAPDEPLATTLDAARRIGFPLVVKASAGGGGRGIRLVKDAAALAPALAAVQDEATRSFRAGGIFLEACVTAARHIEVQLVVGADGVGSTLGIRDCSIQRRHQKVIEEAPSPVLTPALAVELERSAARLGELADYRGVATVEFLVDPARGFAHFLEVNTRLQVEHTVTEAITGVDLVHVQLDIARGLPWQRPSDPPRGHAIEVRLNAEDPERDFQPSPGLVRAFRPPLGPGLRVDSGVAEGVTIAPEFDSMIAKLIVHGRDRRQALARLGRALRELEISIEDGASNKAFLAELIEDPAVVDATADTGWLDRRMAERRPLAERPGSMPALSVAAILVRQRALAERVATFFADVASGIPYRFDEAQRPITLSLRGQRADFEAHLVASDDRLTRWLVGPRPAAGRPDALANLYEARLEPTPGGGPGACILHLDDGLETRRHAVLATVGKTGIAVEVDGQSHLVELASGGEVKAPAPALVVALHAAEGDEVALGQRLATLEAMKMELPVFAQAPGRVARVACRPNEQVQAGQVLFEVEATLADPRAPSPSAPTFVCRPAVRALGWLFSGGEPDPSAIAHLPPSERALAVAELCQVIRLALVGWDVPAALVARAESLLACEDGFRALADPSPYRPLADLLGHFADVEQLFVQELATELGPRPVAGKLAFFEACRALGPHAQSASSASAELVADLAPRLLSALAHHGVSSLDRGPALDQALWRLAVAHQQSGPRHRLANHLLRALIALDEAGLDLTDADKLELFLARTAEVARPELPALRDNARQARYLLFRRRRMPLTADSRLASALAGLPDVAEAARDSVVATLLREVYGPDAHITPAPSGLGVDCHAIVGQGGVRSLAVVLAASLGARAASGILPALRALCAAGRCEVHVLCAGRADGDALLSPLSAALASTLGAIDEHRPTRLAITWTPDGQREDHASYTINGKLTREVELDGIHPERARRLELWRLSGFSLERLPTPPSMPLVALRVRARTNPKDERIFVFAELARAPLSTEPALPAASDASRQELEQVFSECLRVIREAQAKRDASQRYFLNRIVLNVAEAVTLTTASLVKLARRLEGATRGHGLQKVVLQARVLRDGQPQRRVFTFAMRGRHRLEVIEDVPSCAPIRAASDLHLRAERARRLGTVYPYETIRALQGSPGADLALTPHPDMARGAFEELDLDEAGEHLVPVDRPFGENRAGVVVGLMTHVTRKHPEGMTRVWIASDPTTAMGALAEPECRRILAAIALAERRRLPIEWLPVSSGAKIAMDSGTENLDWTAKVLRALVAFTQRGGEVNVIVAGVNVGAQSYWNAEATMLMHTRGVLIMTPDGSMVLTGKRALEVSGSVAAEDERGIGGFERVMGPNGQAQYLAHNLGDAYRILFEHYAFSYVAPGERGPRPHPTLDPRERDVLAFRAALGEGLGSLAELFSESHNPGRKKAFAIREVMRALVDQDGGWLERFADMEGGETAAVVDAHLGGHAITLIGFESRNLPRRERAPLDGPDRWTGGTLFPQSSKKVARALNQASGNRPAVVLANLSGFDGSPESMRKLQLEYGAEIGRAVVNFEGPIVFVVIGRYHGGAYVVFSKALNPRLTAFAVEGAFASVIGGAPAAAVVFPREVRKRADKDPRIVALRAELEHLGADPEARDRRLAELDRLLAEVILEHQGRLAREFDAIHSVERAVRVGSLDAVIAPDALRPRVIAVLDAAAPQYSSPQVGGQRPPTAGRCTASR